MSRAQLTLSGRQDRDRAIGWIQRMPPGTRVIFKDAKRSAAQNDRMWAMLTDVASQKVHCGRKYTPDQWKVLFMHACGREVQFIPSLDNSTFIPWGQSSSDLSKGEMTALIEFMFAWGAENGVLFHDPDSLQPSSPAPATTPASVDRAPHPTEAGNNSKSREVA